MPQHPPSADTREALVSDDRLPYLLPTDAGLRAFATCLDLMPPAHARALLDTLPHWAAAVVSRRPPPETAYSMRSRGEYRALLAALPRHQRHLAKRLANALDDASGRIIRERDHQWLLVLAHMPGLAPLLDTLRVHVEQPPTDCPLCHPEQPAPSAHVA